MRISEIHVYQKHLPIVGGPYTMSRITLHSIDTTIVKLVSDTGLVGWGEVAPIGPIYQPQHALGGLNAMATVRDIAATVEPRLLEAVWTAGSYIEENYDPVNDINVDGGHFQLPTGAGLGIVPDENQFGDALASFN